MFRSFACFAIAALCALPVSGQEVVEVANNAQSADMLNGLLPSQWVRTDANGSLSGTVVTLDSSGQKVPSANVSVLISSRGVLLMESRTNDSGQFAFTGVGVGTYTIQSVGPGVRSAFGIHVLPSSASHLHPSTDVEICAAAVPADLVSAVFAESIIPSSDPDPGYRVFEEDPLAGSRVWRDSHKITLVGGSLSGRVSRPGFTFSEQDLRGSLAYLVSGSSIIGKVAVSADGQFRFNGVVPGVYSLIVAGSDGVAVLGFEAVAGMQSASLADGSRFVSSLQSSGLNTELSDSQNAAAIGGGAGQPGPGPMPPPAPGFVGGGGFGGGFGGGGGGFGGGGGLGGLGAAAALAIGITALADDDDGFNNGLATPLGP